MVHSDESHGISDGDTARIRKTTSSSSTMRRALCNDGLCIISLVPSTRVVIDSAVHGGASGHLSGASAS